MLRSLRSLAMTCNAFFSTLLVGPGGAIKDDEDIIRAIIRETKEEMGVIAEPNRVIIIEVLIGSS